MDVQQKKASDFENVCKNTKALKAVQKMFNRNKIEVEVYPLEEALKHVLLLSNAM